MCWIESEDHLSPENIQAHVEINKDNPSPVKTSELRNTDVWGPSVLVMRPPNRLPTQEKINASFGKARHKMQHIGRVFLYPIVCIGFRHKRFLFILVDMSGESERRKAISRPVPQPCYRPGLILSFPDSVPAEFINTYRLRAFLQSCSGTNALILDVLNEVNDKYIP